jgi:hypothetical protein
MADTWGTDFCHLLDEEGDLVSEPAQDKAMAEYLAAIVFMVSYPDTEYPSEYSVKCRKRQNKKSCPGEIKGFINPESDEIIWMCPECNDVGKITNWRGTMWDLSDSGEVAH